jgi:hypothetical protein
MLGTVYIELCWTQKKKKNTKKKTKWSTPTVIWQHRRLARTNALVDVFWPDSGNKKINTCVIYQGPIKLWRHFVRILKIKIKKPLATPSRTQGIIWLQMYRCCRLCSAIQHAGIFWNVIVIYPYRCWCYNNDIFCVHIYVMLYCVLCVNE